jgi:hypothetical protein
MQFVIHPYEDMNCFNPFLRLSWLMPLLRLVNDFNRDRILAELWL